MMHESDLALSKEAITAKYPKGSPDYPSHHEHCECSGCYSSWMEWRAGHAAYLLGHRAGALAILAECKQWIRLGVYELIRERINNGEFQ